MKTQPQGSSAFEYFTYAPNGARCSQCSHPIEPDEVARRSTLEPASGAPIVVYRHADKCPTT